MAPPSRHLWVGSLSPGVAAADLSELFLRCGDVEGISRDPGRSFAFVTFAREEDAVAAVRELQGIHLRGAPIRIEFSKGVSVDRPPPAPFATVCHAFTELFIIFPVSKSPVSTNELCLSCHGCKHESPKNKAKTMFHNRPSVAIS